MAKQYTINIENGQAQTQILNDTYNVAATVNGYNNASIQPTSITVKSDVDTYDFTIASTGTLTLHVTETGVEGGTVIVGATFNRCDKDGNVYGDVITTSASGDAVFNNVPYASDGAPNIYYKQTASDGAHEFDNTLKTITLTSETQTIQVANPAPVTKTIKLTDANYANLPIEVGTITLS